MSAVHCQYTAPSNGATPASIYEELVKNVVDCEVEVSAQAKIVVESKGVGDLFSGSGIVINISVKLILTNST